MKKCTLVVALLAFVLLSKAEINTNLQKKVLKLKAKTDLILQRNTFLTKNSGVSKSSVHKFPVYLNSTETQSLDSVVSWIYDVENSIWKYDWMDVYEYDSQMRSTFWYENEWNEETGNWEIWGKTETVYGTDGKINSLLWYYRNEETGELFADTKLEFFMNLQDNLDSTVTYMAESDGSWTAVSIQKYQFNGSGRIIKSEMWMMGEDDDGMPTGILEKSMVITYEYNSSNQIILVSNSYYFEGEEFPFSQTEYNYNTSDQLTSAVTLELNFFTFEFENSYKTAYSYNSAGDVNIEVYSDWNSTGNVWMETYKYENTYSNDNFSDVIFPAYFNMIYGIGDPEFMLFNKVIVSDKSFDMIDGIWVQTEKASYYYSGGSTGVNDKENPTVSFYPNPTAGDITLTWNSNNKSLNLQIFAISGAKVLEEKAFAGEMISVSHLVKGMYLVKLLNGQQTVFAGKLIKN